MDCIILMGIKHCGKSTQGKLISSRLGIPFYDTDDVISGMQGRSPRELYLALGERAFMEAEEAACRHIRTTLLKDGSPAVIATGGGICRNVAALGTLRDMGTFVFLQASEKTAADRIVREVRVKADGSLAGIPAYIAQREPRTLDDVRSAFHEFYESRGKRYRKIADITVRMSDAPKAVNTERILSALKERGALEKSAD